MDQSIQVIIESLEKQFNGDVNHDMDVVEKYLSSLDRQNQENIPIFQALGKYCMDKFPEHEAIKKAKAVEKSFDEFQAKLAEAHHCLENKEFEHAVDIYREVIGANEIKIDPEKLAMAFGHPFEEIIYRMNHHETREIEKISVLPVMIYYNMGSALFELKKYDEAKEAFNNALKLNPVHVMSWFELVQIAKAVDDLDEVRSILTKIHGYLFTRHQLGKFYREYAFLAIRDEKFDLAAALIYISMDYEDCMPVRAMLNSIAKHKGTDLNKPTVEVAKKRLTDAHIPMGPLPAVYESAIQIGQQTRKMYPQVAKMAFSIAYDLTHYEPLLKEIESLS